MEIAHIGYVVKDIDQSLDSWIRSGYHVEISKTFDPIQNVFCLILAKAGEPRIELVSPGLSGSTPLASRLRRGGGIDHVCFFTDNIERALEIERSNHSVVVCEPVHAVTFNSQVAFVVRQGGLLIEYLEQR